MVVTLGRGAIGGLGGFELGLPLGLVLGERRLVLGERIGRSPGPMLFVELSCWDVQAYMFVLSAGSISAPRYAFPAMLKGVPSS